MLLGSAIYSLLSTPNVPERKIYLLYSTRERKLKEIRKIIAFQWTSVDFLEFIINIQVSFLPVIYWHYQSIDADGWGHRHLIFKGKFVSEKTVDRFVTLTSFLPCAPLEKLVHLQNNPSSLSSQHPSHREKRLINQKRSGKRIEKHFFMFYFILTTNLIPSQ